MYVIHINDRPLYLRATDGAACPASGEFHLSVPYSGQRKTLLHYADMLEKGSPKVTSVELHADDLPALWADFRSHYKWVPAAGGVVELAGSGKTLFIFRRGSWDLPKGKIDGGEDEPTAALREVTEETGVTDLTLGESLSTTYHTYRSRKEKRVLKPTYWFRMSTRQEALVPQVEEDIERAVWLTIAEVVGGEGPLYPNLRLLLSPLAH